MHVNASSSSKPYKIKLSLNSARVSVFLLFPPHSLCKLQHCCISSVLLFQHLVCIRSSGKQHQRNRKTNYQFSKDTFSSCCLKPKQFLLLNACRIGPILKKNK